MWEISEFRYFNNMAKWDLFVFYLFAVAGSTQTAKEAIDHLTGTENQLQAADRHQSTKQSNVELHHVLRLYAGSPRLHFGQVGRITV